jgi:hypothetical protein
MMKLFKTFCLTALMALLATSAFGAAREVHPGLVMGDKTIETLFVFRHIDITTSDNCLAFSGITDDACDNLALNQYNVSRSFRVTNLRLTVDVAGDAASTCDMFMEVAATAVGNEMTAFSVVTLGAELNQGQDLLVLEDDLFAVNITDDSGCYDTTPPTVTVWVQGFYLE